MFYNRNLLRQSSLIKSFAIKGIIYTIMCFVWINASAQETKTILAYGDSLFSKDNLEDGDSFPEKLESSLKELGFIGNVIGAGNGGYTSEEALKHIESTLDRSPKIDLVILEFGGNDILRNIPPSITYKNMEAMINILNDRKIPVFMAGLIMPFNGYQGYSDRFNYIYTELSEKYSLPLDPFFLEGILGVSEFNQPDGIHPNKFGNTLIASRLSPVILQTMIDIERYDDIQTLLTKLDANSLEADDTANSPNDETVIENNGDKKNILIFGDSLVAGYGLDPEFAFPAQLEVKLKEINPEITVYNAGVSGDTSSAGMARLEWVLSSYDDLDLVIVLFGGNDALRGLHPDMTRRNMDKMTGILKEKNIPTLIAGMVAPPNMGKIYGDNFNSIYLEVAQKYETNLYPFYLDGVAGILELNQNDRIHPNEDGVKYIVDRLTPIVYEIVSSE